MTTQQYQTEGIVIHTIPFKEIDKIVTLFTANSGLLKLYIKGCRRYSHIQNVLTTPLTVGEYLYFHGKKDLHRFRDGTILHQNLGLRRDLDTLQVAEKLTQAVYHTQWPGKPSPNLYTTLRLFLEKLATCTHPTTLHTAFLIKILKHEGLLQLPSSGGDHFRYAGECFLPDTAPEGALAFSTDEERTLTCLANNRSMDTLSSLSLPESLTQKIQSLFDQVLSS